MENAIAIRPMIYKEARECADRIHLNMSNIRRDVVELHDRDGWGALGYKDWTECVQQEFKQAERYIFYQYKAARIEQNVTDCTNVQLGNIPEGQLRPLSKLEPAQQREAWQKAVETAPDGQSLTSLKSKRAKLLTHYEMPHNNNRPGAGVKASAFFYSNLVTNLVTIGFFQ